MPFKSEAQRRKFYAMANSGEISDKTVKRWEEHTTDKKLPERVKKSMYILGVQRAIDTFNMNKGALHGT
jgi:hypothetical protein